LTQRRRLAVDGLSHAGQTPFFAAPISQGATLQLPGFIDLMENVARAWHERRGEVLTQSKAVREALASQQPVRTARPRWTRRRWLPR